MLNIERMFGGTEDILRWLGTVSATGVELTQSSTSCSVEAMTAAGMLRLQVCGVTPNSLYSTGELVPLTLRVEIGRRPETDDALDAYGAWYQAGTLWQVASGGGYRGAVLSGLDPLSPLNRLGVDSIAFFLGWASSLVHTDPLPLRRLAHEVCADASREPSLWERVNLSWRNPWDRQRAQDIGTSTFVRESMCSSGAFDVVDELPGGCRGAIVVTGRFVAVAESSSADRLAVTVDLFRLDRPKPSLALDDLATDVGSLEDSTHLLPHRWATVTVSGASSDHLDGIGELFKVGREGVAAVWLSQRQLERGELERVLGHISRRVRTRTAGPYR